MAGVLAGHGIRALCGRWKIKWPGQDL